MPRDSKPRNEGRRERYCTWERSFPLWCLPCLSAVRTDLSCCYVSVLGCLYKALGRPPNISPYNHFAYLKTKLNSPQSAVPLLQSECLHLTPFLPSGSLSPKPRSSSPPSSLPISPSPIQIAPIFASPSPPPPPTKSSPSP